jgi:transcriptional regulator with XRE-family HTH domain
MSTTTREKRSMKSDPFYAADRLKHIIHTQNLTQQQIAQYLGIVPSALTVAMRRPNSLRRHIRGLSRFLKVPLSEFTGLSDRESEKLLPPEGAPKPGRVAKSKQYPPVETPVALGELVGKPTADGEYALRPGCMLKRIQEGEKGPIQWLLLGPKDADLEINNNVLVRSTDGRYWFRRYSKDPSKLDFVVLLPMFPGDTPLLLHKKEVDWIRIVVAQLKMKGQ